MTSQTGQQIITINISSTIHNYNTYYNYFYNTTIIQCNTIITINKYSNISRSRGNQTMKFGHLIEHDMENIFLKKSFTKCGGEASPRHFYKQTK